MADSYLTWEDLLDEEKGADPSPPAGEPSPPVTPVTPVTHCAPALPEGFELPEEVRALFRARKALEHQMKVLTGEAPPPDEDPHHKAKFPVKAHTKESRIEERRLNLRDQQRQMTTKQLQEKAILARQREAERQREIQAHRDEAARRERLERQAEAREEERQKELERRLAEAERVRQRWTDQSAAALQRARQTLRHAAVVEETRAEAQQRLAEAKVLLLHRKQEEEEASAEEQQRLREAEINETRRRAQEEADRADEQRRLKEAEIARTRLQQKAEAARGEAADRPKRERPPSDLDQWEVARSRMTARVLERRRGERQAERRRKAD